MCACGKAECTLLNLTQFTVKILWWADYTTKGDGLKNKR
jgi:hypothetical protein